MFKEDTKTYSNLGAKNMWQNWGVTLSYCSDKEHSVMEKQNG